MSGGGGGGVAGIKKALLPCGSRAVKVGCIYSRTRCSKVIHRISFAEGRAIKATPAGRVFRADNIVATERVGSESDKPLNFIKRRDAAGQVGRVNASASEKSRRSAVGYCLYDESVWQPSLSIYRSSCDSESTKPVGFRGKMDASNAHLGLPKRPPWRCCLPNAVRAAAIARARRFRSV